MWKEYVSFLQNDVVITNAGKKSQRNFEFV